MRLDHEIRDRISEEGELCSLNPQQAAVFLQTSEETLASRREMRHRAPDGYAKPPFFRVGNEIRYPVSELIAFHIENSSNGPTPFMRTLAVMLGPEFCQRVKVPYPNAATSAPPISVATQSAPADEPSADEDSAAPQPSILSSLLGLQADGAAPASRKRGPKPRKEEEANRRALERAGIHIQVHRCEFASLHDFLLRAEPEDQWLFSCPTDGRPYDAIAAIFARPGDERFEWLTLADYLDQVREHARIDRNARIAEEEEAAIYVVAPGLPESKQTL